MNLDPKYPTGVICIIATEFCERFSFCGLRTILSLYLRNNLFFNEDAATVIYHVFIVACYTVPVMGAVCADSVFGRYRTIRSFSLVYLLGNILMCIAAVPVLNHSPVALSSLGLLLVAIGSGGLKPCVAAFGAEQFILPEQSGQLRYFFSIFYFTINFGGFMGMMLTPMMRNILSCFGDDTCYALGFGITAVLMVISILLLILGKRLYRLKTPKRNIMLEFTRCSWYAARKRCDNTRISKQEHWLDYSKEKFNWKLIQDMKRVFTILLLFLPLPIFWSLFDQQGSRWTFQASHMDGNLLGVQIVPDQMQIVNPALVLILIPTFDNLLYPSFGRINLFKNPLHRMVTGGMAAGLAFIGAGVLELILEKSYPRLPEKNRGSVNVVNTLPCSIIIYSPFSMMVILDTAEIFRFQNIKCHNLTTYTLKVDAPTKCGSIMFKKETFEVEAELQEFKEDTLVIGVNEQHEIQGYISDPLDFRKSVTGSPKFRVDFVKNTNNLQDINIALKSSSGMQDVYFAGVHSSETMIIVSPYIEIPQGVYVCKISSQANNSHFEKRFHFGIGGVYSLIIWENGGKLRFVKLYTVSEPNSITILWQIPQYLFVSVAEVMFGVAGLEFSFTQAPKSMKAVTIAGWYLYTAIGNVLVVIITQSGLFKSQANEFFFFAILIVADMVIFMEMVSRYEFRELEAESSTFIMELPDPSLSNFKSPEEN